MNYLDTIKNQIGHDRFERLEKEADKELSLALNTPLKNQYGDKKYYRKRVLVGELFPDCDFFDEKGLGLLPTDLVDGMFRAKLLFASQDEDSFLQRSGEGSFALGIWSHKPAKYDEALEAFFEWIKDSIKERTLLTQLSSFIGPSKSGSGQDFEAVQRFLEQLFQGLGAPFVAFVNQEALMDKYKQMQPGLREYTEEHCRPQHGNLTTQSLSGAKTKRRNEHLFEAYEQIPQYVAAAKRFSAKLLHTDSNTIQNQSP